MGPYQKGYGDASGDHVIRLNFDILANFDICMFNRSEDEEFTCFAGESP